MDASGQYSAAAVASVSVVAPKASQPSDNKESFVAPTFIRQSKTGVDLLQFVPLVIVIGAAIFMIFLNKRGKGGKK